MGWCLSKIVCVIEINVEGVGRNEPEMWMKNLGWRTPLFSDNFVWQYHGCRSVINADGREQNFHAYGFTDRKKARLFMLAWLGNRK